jgi:hypothetical protein
LKKRRRLLNIGVVLAARRSPMDKSFLVLFFKKEHSYFAAP